MLFVLWKILLGLCVILVSFVEKQISLILMLVFPTIYKISINNENNVQHAALYSYMIIVLIGWSKLKRKRQKIYLFI